MISGKAFTTTSILTLVTCAVFAASIFSCAGKAPSGSKGTPEKTDGVSGATHKEASSQANPKDAPSPSASTVGAVRISGAVKNPMTLTVADLLEYQSVEVRLNNVTREGEFKGVFKLRGVPLKVLLAQAKVEKAKDAVFNRKLDMAVVLTNEAGEKVSLSYGEVFYQDGDEILITTSSKPIFPHKECASCHTKEEYEPWKKQLLRSIPFPKLVVTGDNFSDRSLEDIVSIEVVDPGAETGISVPKKDAPDDIRSEKVEITLPGGGTGTLGSLEGIPRVKADIIQAGDGTGYHGIRKYEGYPLRAVLKAAGFKENPSSGILLSARDGYRILLSNGEVFGPQRDDELILADTMNGAPLTTSGKYQLVSRRDQAADRWLRSVARIDWIDF